MPITLLTALTVLSVYRLTRLITADQITQPFRTWVLRRNRWLGYLVTCDWCLSIWVAPIPVTLAVVWPDSQWVWGVLIILAGSAITGLISLVEARLDRD